MANVQLPPALAEAVPSQFKPNAYVGMRYVPILDGEWDSTKTYEPLTVVSYMGDSYTSRTFVAAGILPTNSQYWAATGNYNAQVEQYRQEVMTFNDRINANADAIANINSKNILLITDSFGDPTEDFDPYTVIAQGWYNSTGHKLDYLAVSGLSFGNQQNAFNATYRITNFANNQSAETRADYGLVAVCLGTNDQVQETANIQNGITSAFAAIRSLYPNARPVLLFTNNPSPTLVSQRLDTIRTYEEMAARNSVPYKHKMSLCGWGTNMQQGDSRGVHPNKSGSIILAQCLMSLLFDGDYTVINSQTLTPTLNDAWVNQGGSPSITFRQHNHDIAIQINGITTFRPQSNYTSPPQFYGTLTLYTVPDGWCTSDAPYPISPTGIGARIGTDMGNGLCWTQYSNQTIQLIPALYGPNEYALSQLQLGPARLFYSVI